MKFRNYLFDLLILFSSCFQNKKENIDETYSSFEIKPEIVKNDTIKKLFQLPEIKNYPNDSLINHHRTAYVKQTATFNDLNTFSRSGSPIRLLHFEDYKCDAKVVQDTLNITLNNYNGHFGNGIVIKVINGKYFVKNINPNPVKTQPYFLKIDESKVSEELILNKKAYVIGDSIMGRIDYQCVIPENFKKRMLGYFRTKVE